MGFFSRGRGWRAPWEGATDWLVGALEGPEELLSFWLLE